jgi:hypothetical protein
MQSNSQLFALTYLFSQVFSLITLIISWNETVLDESTFRNSIDLLVNDVLKSQETIIWNTFLFLPISPYFKLYFEILEKVWMNFRSNELFLSGKNYREKFKENQYLINWLSDGKITPLHTIPFYSFINSLIYYYFLELKLCI